MKPLYSAKNNTTKDSKHENTPYIYTYRTHVLVLRTHNQRTRPHTTPIAATGYPKESGYSSATWSTTHYERRKGKQFHAQKLSQYG